ncbi:MAG: 16S rRNA (guanine(527)-N(7))-methyltransferase RsmG [Alphaproteobacteria bacterium]
MNHTIFSGDASIVSRETKARLESYVALLKKWNRKINLIGRISGDEIWQRHIADSMQLIPHLPRAAKTVADIGSGAGLPGLVLAMMSDKHFTLIERDQRKCAFLAEAIRECSIMNVDIFNSDVAEMRQKFDVLTARALANLNELLVISDHLIMEKTICLFPKGESYAMELDEAKKHWDFSCQLLPSLTHKKSRILVISELRKRGG